MSMIRTEIDFMLNITEVLKLNIKDLVKDIKIDESNNAELLESVKSMLKTVKKLEKQAKNVRKSIKKASKTNKKVKTTSKEKQESARRVVKKPESTVDSTKSRDKLIEGLKKAQPSKNKEIINDIKLATFENNFEIVNTPGKLPVDCELENVKCIFTPQRTIIIKAGSKVDRRFADMKSSEFQSLSSITQNNIIKAYKRAEEGGEGIVIEKYSPFCMLTGDLTCSSRKDAKKLITGFEDVSNIDFHVGKKTLSEYMNIGSK